VQHTDARIEALESALTPEQRKRATLEAQALQLLSIARSEGMLLDPIERRPGGFIEGLDQPL
jgi:hypothetical protein